jgi:protein transport protein SEC31
MAYYANETSGETTWDRPPVAAQTVTVVENMPNFAAAAATPMKDSSSVKSTTSSVSSASRLSTKAALVSKYGDGFVTSASHPELADQYGNVGTSNPYTGVSRPGTAAAVLGGSQLTEQAPPSGPLDLSALELEGNHAHMKDTLLSLFDYLQSVSFPSEKRQLDEAKRGIDILIKKLSRNAIEEDTESKVLSMVAAIANHDIRTAAAIQTSLVSTDWKDHKDWLKGIKVLLQLATKKM